MYVSICKYNYTYMYIYICIHIYIYIHTYIYIYIVFIYIYVYIHLHIYIYSCTYIYIHVHIYIHIYSVYIICVYIYTHANPYMITDLFFLWPLWSKSSAYGMLSIIPDTMLLSGKDWISSNFINHPSNFTAIFPLGNSSWIIAHQVRIWGSLISYLKNLGFYYRWLRNWMLISGI